MTAKKFNFRNKCVRHLLAIAMAYMPSISNSSASLFIPCILASYFTEIGYNSNPGNIASISPSRNTLSNLTEEALVSTMLDLERELSGGVRVFIVSDHGNNKGLHHFVKVLSWWSKEDGHINELHWTLMHPEEQATRLPMVSMSPCAS